MYTKPSYQFTINSIYSIYILLLIIVIKNHIDRDKYSGNTQCLAAYANVESEKR